VLQEAHDRACTEIRPGVEVSDIFRVAQDHITKNGIERLHRMPHGLKTFS
jgi:Xaa-Pro aminopeptidase